MKKKIAIIEETGAAGETDAQAVKVLQAVAEQYDHYFDISGIRPEAAPAVFSAAEAGNDAILLSSAATQLLIEDTLPVLVTVQPVTVYPSLQHLSPLKPKHCEGLNLLLYQEKTPGADESSRLRIAQSALQQAIRRKKKITVIDHPEEEQEPPSWTAIFEKAGKAFGSNIRTGQMPVQEAWDRMLLQPADFDVVIAGAAAGQYLFRQAAAITGAPLMIPSVRVAGAMPFFGPAFGYDHQEESARNSSNPIGAILSVAMMMNYFNLLEEAMIIRAAVSWTLLHGFVTKDIDPVNNYSTSTIGDLISDFIRGTIPGFAKGENMALQKSTII
ncbi:isocitrate/isopropylmalate family dehydrogenase [Niabella aurantiaca]|uniref:isocitrate/isopropylmalate family dehydrogenase n=1 Tax=Niabella aurantiaca TaxID=379900 RepID=UPI00037681D0|nr:isocitrate/isopropylmalate family dehydrogenase [Niabella aurantiaca]